MREIEELALSAVILAFCFSISSLLTSIEYFPIHFSITLIAVGSHFILHELAHKFVAQTFGHQAEYRIWPLGLVFALLFSILSRGSMVFAAPGAVYIFPRLTGAFYYERSIAKEDGMISIAGPLTNILLSAFFLSFSRFMGIFHIIGEIGYRVGIFLACFNLLPLPPLDGFKVFRWNKLVWLLVTIPSWIILLI